MNKEDNLTLTNCYDILSKYKTPDIVIKHTKSVAKVCYLIGKQFNEENNKVNMNTLLNSAILHDIFKIIEVNDYYEYQPSIEVKLKEKFWNSLKQKFKGLDHETAFTKEFGKLYPRISRIVLKHKYQEILKGFETNEEKILYYADKIVQFDKITTLKKRLAEAKKRHAHKNMTDTIKKIISKADKKIFLLEKQIFKTTGLSPKDLINLNNISLDDLINKDVYKKW